MFLEKDMLKVKKMTYDMLNLPYYIRLKFEHTSISILFLANITTLKYFEILVELKNNKIEREGVSRAT